MSLETATFLFLVAAFVAAEIYRMKRGLRGIIIAAHDEGFGHLLLPVMTVKVKLQGGDEIDARLNCCTACLGRLQVGDEVRVVDSRDGYVIDLPWRRRSHCNDSRFGTCLTTSDTIQKAASSR